MYAYRFISGSTRSILTQSYFFSFFLFRIWEKIIVYDSLIRFCFVEFLILQKYIFEFF